ncbi:NAD(+) diphosphatase [Rhodobacteraceae bacterium NNCM2]|nr:NAD(+) diphosphatase [Coraliihabitans acroporae]
MLKTQEITFAARSGQLDRASHLRGDAATLMRDEKAALLPFWRDKLLFDVTGDRPALGWVPPLPDYIDEAPDGVVFLGLADETPCFTADFSELDEERVEEFFGDGAKFIDLRTVAGELSPMSASIAATAKGVLSWHGTHRFCSRCGNPSRHGDGGWRRRCVSCGALHFPRTDPVVIMLIVRDDHVLLGRQSVWPEGLYSLLAGFMEPGETIEDAVRRETFEESGVEIGEVRYVACQPWPFPSSLMLGCMAEALTDELTIDHNELEDAEWFSRAKVEVILQGKHPRIRSPRKDAIASSILRAWVAGELERF